MLDTRLLEQIKPELEAIRPWKAVFDRQYVKRLDGPNVKKGANKRELAEQVRADIRAFKTDARARSAGDDLVRQHRDLPAGGRQRTRRIAAFEQALEANDASIPSSMIYAYAALKEGIPYANGAPNLSADIPALVALAAETRAPIAGKDFKTGQTLIKTAIAPA